MNEVEDLSQRSLPRTMQIIAAALCLGTAMFLAIALFLVYSQNNGQGLAPPAGLPVMTMVAVVLFPVQVLLAVVVPRAQTQALLRRIAAGTWRPPPGAPAASFSTDAAKLLAGRQTSLIISLALLEAAAFLGGIAFLLEAQTIALVVAALALGLMLALVPTEGRIRGWLQQQGDALEVLRQQEDVTG